MSVSLRKEDTRTQDYYIISFTELLSSFAIIQSSVRSSGTYF